MLHFSKIILSRSSRTLTGAPVQQLYALLRDAGCEVYPDETCRGVLDAPGAGFPPLEALAHCDLALVVGGDGTLLNAARTLAPHGVPVAGVNLGRLGFLVDIPPAGVPEAIQRILHGEYVKEHRFLLEATVSRAGETICRTPALNDVVINSQSQTRRIEFFIHLGDHHVNHERGTGLIIATPTGSTAYALSCGGPVLHPSLPAVVLVPICPFTLSHRPLVIDAATPVTVVVDPDCATPSQISFDGRSNFKLRPGDRIDIKQSSARATLLHPWDYDFFDITREKLNWGKGV